SLPFDQCESKVNITPKASRCCDGVKLSIPGRSSAPRKKPPLRPRETSKRYSSRAIVFVHRDGTRYSSVVVTALMVCADPVQRPSRSHADSGRSVTLHGPRTVK